MATEVKAEFFEVSAKDGSGINELFERCALRIHELGKKPEPRVTVTSKS